MKRIDHLAFRVLNRGRAVDFFTKALGYRLSAKHPDGFQVDFEDGTYARCSVLEPKNSKIGTHTPWVLSLPDSDIQYHYPPEIFVSEGSKGSIVDKWVRKKGNGLHHVAVLVNSVEETQKEWIENGYAEFASDHPTKCPGLTQIFSKPSDITGIIWELIEREPLDDGFCAENVKTLMESTNEFTSVVSNKN